MYVHGCLRFHWHTLLPSVYRLHWCVGSFSTKQLFPPTPWPSPLPNRSCSATHAGAMRSFGLLQTLARLSMKSTQNLDSSVKRTGVQSLTVHVTWVCDHCEHSWKWRCVGMQIAGLLDLKPASYNLFLTFCILTRTPVAFWKSLRRVVAFYNFWGLAWRTINQSWAISNVWLFSNKT